jgi:multidrug resistance protein
MRVVPPSVKTPSEASRVPRGARQRAILLVVFATILIDFVGFSVLIPVLPLYADRLGATPFQVGLILACYAFVQLLFLPVWGWISDRIGRRPVLLISLLGTALSFVLLALARSVETIYLARGLAGFFAASVGTAQAVVTDVTPPAERAHGMGLIGAAFGAGMIVGPMLGGFLAAIQESLPFYAIAVLAAVNLVLTAWLLPESRPLELARPPWRELLGAFVPTPFRLVLAVHDRRIGLYLFLFFQIFTGFAVLESMTTLFLGKRFGADELDAALIFAWIGLFLAITQGVLVRRLVLYMTEPVMVRTGLAVMGVGIGAIAFAPSYGWFFALAPIIAFGSGIAFPAFNSLYSKACQAEQAGELFGQSQSMATAGRIVGPIAAGYLMRHVGLGTPFVVAALLLLAALVVLLVFQRTLAVSLD